MLFSGCKSIESYYLGYLSENKSNLTLADNSTHQGSWKTFDIVVNYQVETQNEQLDISGAITLGNYYMLNSARITSLDVYLFFVDDTAKVLETTRLSKSVYVQAADPIYFHKRLRVPPATKAISFGYYGESQGDGGNEGTHSGGGGGLEWFGKLPKRTG